MFPQVRGLLVSVMPGTFIHVYDAGSVVQGLRGGAALEHLDAGDSPAGWDPLHHHLSAAEARARLLDAPPVDRLVVCHADACAPNTLVHDDGRWAAHVDLGRLGVADRWADLAIATWSTIWNYGPGYERHVLDAYGIEPDDERTAYYRLLWDAT